MSKLAHGKVWLGPQWRARRPGMPSGAVTACWLVLTFVFSGAGAQEPGGPIFRFNAFGTLGIVHSSEEQADFTSNVLKPDGAGHSHDWSANVDSIIAGQLTAQLTPRISAMLQVVSQQRYDDTYRPSVEWANIKYAVTPDFAVRGGRSVMPSFLVSDDRKVGYALPWVRPPVEVYWLVPITANDGIDASYRLQWGDTTSIFQANYGNLHSDDPGNNENDADNQWGIYDTLEIGPLTIHAAYHQAQLTLTTLQEFFAGFRNFGPQGAQIADHYTCDGKLIPLRSIGANYDPGRWFLMGEWARSDSRCFLGAQSGWYVSSGYRIGNLTPYLTYAALKAQSNTSDPGLPAPRVPQLQGVVAALNGALNAILSGTGSENSLSAGARWDFYKNVDLKLQMEHIRLLGGTSGVLINTQPGFQPNVGFTVCSVAMDFVF
jgi:hypothetical protein